jgi:hypothetical protein
MGGRGPRAPRSHLGVLVPPVRGSAHPRARQPVTSVGTGEGVRGSSSVDAVEVYRAFTPSGAHLEALKSVGREVLLVFPPMPGACAVMSAAYAARLQTVTDAPVYVVAGALSVGGDRVFGGDRATDWGAAFCKDDLSWDGHC